jgi:hypothetical protein
VIFVAAHKEDAGPRRQTFANLRVARTANVATFSQNFVVTNDNADGTGSLREAITNANATPGADTIVFNIPGPGVKTINLPTPLPDITEQIVIDGTTQPGYAGTPLIQLDGTGNTGNGFVIKAGGSTVRGLAIGNFRSGNAAIWLFSCDNNVIQGNYLGVDANGTTAKPNVRGILLSISSNNTIGGTTTAARNVISASIFDGIEIGGNENVVQGNFIGTNAAGTAEIANGSSGITIQSSPFTNNVIGGTAAGAGNLISGNQRGVNTSGTGTVIQGNLIGTDVTGTSKVPNGVGVSARGTNILVGGLTAAARNIISGNNGDGVSVSGADTKVQGNYIGTDITGTLALGNGGSGVVAGDHALIGGTVPEARNIISANGGFGNVSLGSNSIGSAAVVQGNYIGTDVTGTKALSNLTNNVFAGVSISDVNNVVGGVAPGAGNVISGNGYGIQIGGSTTALLFGNVIQGNLIGLNALGTGPLPNSFYGIVISGANNNTIGGTQTGAANKIAFSGGAGVRIFDGNGNVIRGNSIFSNGELGIDLGSEFLTGVTPNDPIDSDHGANLLQNFPVLTSVLSTSNSTNIQGSLTSTANTTFQIDFYSSAALDPSGNGEGAQFLGSISVNTDGTGNASINANLPVGSTGRVVTATATDPNGNTSEFSAGDATNATGSVQFSVNSFSVIEDVGVANVTVVRKGGSTGNLSVEYSTADVTAIAGQDYTSVSGTLNFSDGETSKTIQIPISDDATTEPDETFTLSLRNPSNLEALAAPTVVTITIQDRSKTPAIFIFDTAVVEGTGSTTQALFIVNLTAASGRSVSVNYSTTSFLASGGASCNEKGVDFENAAGTISFQPGTTSVTVPVKICGDKNAESNETFGLTLSNPVNATFIVDEGQATIVNDDLLILLLEDSGPTPNQAAAVDADLFLRDPYRVQGIPDWFSTDPDRNTRLFLFAQNLELNPGEAPFAVIVRFIGSNNQVFDVPAIDVRNVRESLDPFTQRDSEITQVKVRLPNNLPVGTCTVIIRAHGRSSNMGTIRIVP